MAGPLFFEFKSILHTSLSTCSIHMAFAFKGANLPIVSRYLSPLLTTSEPQNTRHNHPKIRSGSNLVCLAHPIYPTYAKLQNHLHPPGIECAFVCSSFHLVANMGRVSLIVND